MLYIVVFILLALESSSTQETKTVSQDKVKFMLLATLNDKIPPRDNLPDTPPAPILRGLVKLELENVVMFGLDNIKVLDVNIDSEDDKGIHLKVTFQFVDLAVTALRYSVGIFRAKNKRANEVENRITATLFFDKSSCFMKLNSLNLEHGELSIKKMCLLCSWVSKGNTVNEFIKDSVVNELWTVVSDALEEARINRSIYSTCPPYIPEKLKVERKKYVINGHEVSLDLIVMEPDGACLFNAFSMAMYGSQKWSLSIRNEVVDFIIAHYDHYGAFLTTANAEEYSKYMRKPRVFGTFVELNAASDLYETSIIVIRDDQVHSTVGKHEWNTIVLRFSGSLDAGHYDLLWPSVLPEQNLDTTGNSNQLKDLLRRTEP